MPKHHLWRCTPGRIELQEFDTGTPAVGVGFFRWLCLEEVLAGEYAYTGMLDRWTWVWEKKENANG